VVRGPEGPKTPPAAGPADGCAVFRYRLQRPVLGALPTEWDPLRGLPWRGHRYCASRGGGSSFAKAPCGLRPPAGRPPPAGGGIPYWGGRRRRGCGGSTPLGRCGADPRFGGDPPPAGGAGSGGRHCRSGEGGRSPPLRLAISRPSGWPVFFIHTLWRVPHHWFARGNSRLHLSIWAVFAGWGGDSLPPGPHPTAAQGRRWVHRRAAG
jgi:hypothetical protein